MKLWVGERNEHRIMAFDDMMPWEAGVFDVEDVLNHHLAIRCAILRLDSNLRRSSDPN